MTYEELKYKQSWTLNQKIDHSLYIIDAFLAQCPDSVVAYSGGVDSVVMLKLVRLIDKNRKAVFANTTNEHSDMLKFARDTEGVEMVLPRLTFQQTVANEGFPLISKKVARMIHDVRNPTPNNEASRNLYLTGIKRDGTKSKDFKIPAKYMHLIDAPFDITHKCCDILKKQPMRALSKGGVLIGTRADESQTRKGAYLKTGCIDLKGLKCLPMSIWTREDEWKFIRDNHIPYCKVYDEGEENTGCAYCGFGCQFDKTRFLRLKDREPKRYAHMMALKNNGITFKEALKIALDI